MPASPQSAERRRGDAGYTMIELIVVIAIAGTLMAAAVSGWQTWSAAAAHDGAATELQGVLRQAQQRAVTEGSSTCVLFSTDADTWSVYRGTCSSETKSLLEGPDELGDRLRFAAPVFASGPTGTSPGVTFTPRGTATPGSVQVRRDGSETVRTIRVERLTGRVSTS
jgi:type II secretion system protein H